MNNAMPFVMPSVEEIEKLIDEKIPVKQHQFVEEISPGLFKIGPENGPCMYTDRAGMELFDKAFRENERLNAGPTVQDMKNQMREDYFKKNGLPETVTTTSNDFDVELAKRMTEAKFEGYKKVSSTKGRYPMNKQPKKIKRK